MLLADVSSLFVRPLPLRELLSSDHTCSSVGEAVCSGSLFVTPCKVLGLPEYSWAAHLHRAQARSMCYWCTADDLSHLALQVLQSAVCPERHRGKDFAMSAVASVTEVELSKDLQVRRTLHVLL